MSREDVQEWRHRRKLPSGWRHVAADAQDVWRWRKQEEEEVCEERKKVRGAESIKRKKKS